MSLPKRTLLPQKILYKTRGPNCYENLSDLNKKDNREIVEYCYKHTDATRNSVIFSVIRTLEDVSK